MDDETLKSFKDFVTYSVIPKALVVSVIGNLINFILLSRPCIKSPTNVFLSILAFVDTFFMVFIYVSSKQYHGDVHEISFEIYWRLFGLSNWFYTASLFASVYLTFSLTLDRYAAMCRPTTTKCGIARAKNVVSIVLFACVIFSISAAFEFQLETREYRGDELCLNNRSQVTEKTLKTFSNNEAALAASNKRENVANLNFNEDDNNVRHHHPERSFDNDANTTVDDDDSLLRRKTDVNHYVNETKRDNVTSSVIPQQNHNTCSTHLYLYPVESGLAKNKIYRALFKSIALILLLLPLGSMIVLSGMLSTAVYRRCKFRRSHLPTTMTDRPAKTTETDILIRENKITMLVITLVVIFLICHIPNAVYSLYKSWQRYQKTFSDDMKIKNFILALDLSCQALMSINCCMKIFIYPLAHDEYWTSMKSLRNCLRCSTGSGEQIINTSKHLFPTTKADVESLLNYSLNKKRYSTQIPPEARHYRPTLAVPRLQKPSFLSSTSNNSIAPNLSLTPSFTEGFEMNQRVTNRITVERQPSTRSNKSFIPLHLSPSQASLTRSKSLNIQSTMKHSPNCRLNKKF